MGRFRRSFERSIPRTLKAVASLRADTQRDHGHLLAVHGVQSHIADGTEIDWQLGVPWQVRWQPSMEGCQGNPYTASMMVAATCLVAGLLERRNTRRRCESSKAGSVQITCDMSAALPRPFDPKSRASRLLPAR